MKPIKRYDEVPEWARFLTLDELRFFLEAVARELRARNLFFEDRGGFFIVASPDGSLVECGLQNIVLKCGAVGRERYAHEIHQHFERVLGPRIELPSTPPPFSEVKPYIKVRIYRDDYVEENGVPLISQPLTQGLTAAAVFDMPNVVTSISPETIAPWGVSKDVVFRIGITNVGRAKMRREPHRFGAVELFSLSDEDGFAASQVYHLATFLPPSRLGAIVSMPSRHLILCYPILRDTVRTALRELVPFTDDIYNDPERGDERHMLSTDLFWWRKGKLVRMPVGMNVPGFPGVMVAPPQEFIVEVLGGA
jgi:hypothetical protein